jgi:hypothetical protein
VAQAALKNPNASEEEQIAAQRELVKLKDEGVALAQKEGSLRAGSLREQAAGLAQQQQAYNDIAKSEFARMQASKEAFALMSRGQQNRLLRDLDRFNAGQSLGPGRAGLRREQRLVQSGLIGQDNERYQRDIGAAVPQRAFAEAQKNVDNAVQNAARIGKEISDKMGEAFKAGIDAEKLADAMRDASGDLVNVLIGTIRDEFDRAKAGLTREGAAARAANAAKESTTP